MRHLRSQTGNRIAPLAWILAIGFATVVMLSAPIVLKPDIHDNVVASAPLATMTVRVAPGPLFTTPLSEISVQPAIPATFSGALMDTARPRVATRTTTPSDPLATIPVQPTTIPLAPTSPLIEPTLVPTVVTPITPAAVVTPTADVTIEPTLAASQASTTRLVIPSIGVDSAVEVKSLDPGGVMQTPSAPDVVSWYDFSSQPSDDGNAVFAGHLDYANYGIAVFWRLAELQPGALIEVYQRDDTVLTYRVTSVRSFAATDEATSVVASSGRPTITLITCEGTFDSATGAYDERLVVTGDRVD